jgi:hypothetical protein
MPISSANDASDRLEEILVDKTFPLTQEEEVFFAAAAAARLTVPGLTKQFIVALATRMEKFHLEARLILDMATMGPYGGMPYSTSRLLLVDKDVFDAYTAGAIQRMTECLAAFKGKAASIIEENILFLRTEVMVARVCAHVQSKRVSGLLPDATARVEYAEKRLADELAFMVEVKQAQAEIGLPQRVRSL